MSQPGEGAASRDRNPQMGPARARLCRLRARLARYPAAARKRMPSSETCTAPTQPAPTLRCTAPHPPGFPRCSACPVFVWPPGCSPPAAPWSAAPVGAGTRAGEAGGSRGRRRAGSGAAGTLSTRRAAQAPCTQLESFKQAPCTDASVSAPTHLVPPAKRVEDVRRELLVCRQARLQAGRGSARAGESGWPHSARCNAINQPPAGQQPPGGPARPGPSPRRARACMAACRRVATP